MAARGGAGARGESTMVTGTFVSGFVVEQRRGFVEIVGRRTRCGQGACRPVSTSTSTSLGGSGRGSREALAKRARSRWGVIAVTGGSRGAWRRHGEEIMKYT